MSVSADDLYRLLPSLYRTRDAELGEPLHALLSVLAEQAAILDDDLDRLYDDVFIETCADWVTPYIGDLIGYRTIHGVVAATASRRAEVANTIRYRRRKGTATVLEELARDVTGWPAHALEFFTILGWTQNMNHIRPATWYAPGLRRWEPLERRDTAFDSLSHTLNVRRIAPREGRHNISNVGLFTWRLTAYPRQLAMAAALDARRWRFDPMGMDIPLFTSPEVETEITRLATPFNTPAPISRRVLDAYTPQLYPGSLRIVIDGVPAPLADIRAADLSDAGAGAWAHTLDNQIGVDPVLGRIALPQNRPAPASVLVDHHYGFPADLGGGPYARGTGFATDLAPLVQIASGQNLTAALAAQAPGGVLEITDSSTFAETPAIALDAGARLELRSANEQRTLLELGGDLVITGGAESEVTINGLAIAGGRIIVPAGGHNALRRLVLRHVTLVPGISRLADGSPVSPAAPSLVIEADNVTVEIESSILGGIRAIAGTEMMITGSIVDATDPANIAFSDSDDLHPGGDLTLVDTTVIGKVHAASLPLVSNAILDAALAPADPWPTPVRAARRQIGCVRFSYVPPLSRVPRRYHCQPDTAARQAIAAALAANPLLTDVQKDRITARERARVTPVFTDRRYGRPAYMQLLTEAPPEIREGADDEGSMGAYHPLYERQREADLRIRLDEYLPFELEAGGFHET